MSLSKSRAKVPSRAGHPVASADFDESYQPINDVYPGSAPANYTVQDGDTLHSIAQAAWGDACCGISSPLS